MAIKNNVNIHKNISFLDVTVKNFLYESNAVKQSGRVLERLQVANKINHNFSTSGSQWLK